MRKNTIKSLALFISLFLLSCNLEEQKEKPKVHLYQIKLLSNGAKMGWQNMHADGDVDLKVGDTILYHGLSDSIPDQIIAYPAVITDVYE